MRWPIDPARVRLEKGQRRWVNATRRAFLPLLALGTSFLCGVGRADADSRFGDSTWVAPAAMFDSPLLEPVLER